MKYPNSKLHTFDDFFDNSNYLCFIIRSDLNFIKETIDRLKHKFIFLFNDFFELRKLVVNYKNKIWFIITWLLANQNKVPILNLWFHTIPLCSYKETILQITSPNKGNRNWHFFLRIFIDDLLSLIPTLCKAIDWKLNDIIKFISDFLS